MAQTTSNWQIIPSKLVFAAILCAAFTSTATDGRYREYIIGERAGGMGGAAIAVARDGWVLPLRGRPRDHAFPLARVFSASTATTASRKASGEPTDTPLTALAT